MGLSQNTLRIELAFVSELPISFFLALVSWLELDQNYLVDEIHNSACEEGLAEAIFKYFSLFAFGEFVVLNTDSIQVRLGRKI